MRTIGAAAALLLATTTTTTMMALSSSVADAFSPVPPGAGGAAVPSSTTSPSSPLPAAASSSSSSSYPSSSSSSSPFDRHHRHHRRGDDGDDDDDVPPLRRHPPRRIALLVEPTPFTHVSGYANRFNEMLRYLSKAGDKVDVLTVDAKTPKDQLPTEVHGHPVEHTQGFVFPLYDRISLTVDLPEMRGARMMERSRPDLLHVTSPGFMLFAGLFYARVMRLPLLLSYHTHLPLYGRNYMGFVPGIEEMCWAALRFVHGRADLTLVTSPQMKEEMERNGIPRVDVWRKGIDTSRFHPKFKCDDMRHRMSGGRADDFLLVYVGRLGAEKRLKDLRPTLEACPGARLCIVGGGPQEDELREYFDGTGAVFTGQLRGDELSAAFASADAFVMPSDSETLGFVVLESMASGVPVIGCAAGGIPDLIRDGDTGYLVPPGDVDGYADRVRGLMRDPASRRRMGERARAEAERWGWEAATSVLRNVQYERAMVNFHSRAFGGFGRPNTTSVWRLLRMRIARVLGRLRVPGFRRNGGGGGASSPI